MDKLSAGIDDLGDGMLVADSSPSSSTHGTGWGWGSGAVGAQWAGGGRLGLVITEGEW